jgi:hypothetical protein
MLITFYSSPKHRFYSNTHEIIYEFELKSKKGINTKKDYLISLDAMTIPGKLSSKYYISILVNDCLIAIYKNKILYPINEVSSFGDNITILIQISIEMKSFRESLANKRFSVSLELTNINTLKSTAGATGAGNYKFFKKSFVKRQFSYPKAMKKNRGINP